MSQLINIFAAEILFPSIKQPCQIFALIINNTFCLKLSAEKTAKTSVSSQDNYSECYQQIFISKEDFSQHSPPTYRCTQDYNQYMLIKP